MTSTIEPVATSNRNPNLRCQAYECAGCPVRNHVRLPFYLCLPCLVRGGTLNEDGSERQHAPPAPILASLAGTYEQRKAAPIADGLLGYFPNACAYVSHVSKVANEQHNPGEPMHWAFDKSIGTGNEIARHLSDTGPDTDGLLHEGKVAWRALELLERYLLKHHPEMKPGKNVKGFVR